MNPRNESSCCSVWVLFDGLVVSLSKLTSDERRFASVIDEDVVVSTTAGLILDAPKRLNKVYKYEKINSMVEKRGSEREAFTHR